MKSDGTKKPTLVSSYKIFMNSTQIVAQFYTLRAHATNRDDFITSCKKIRNIGYRAIQASCIDTKVPAREVAAICADLGLKLVASHTDIDPLIERPEESLEELRQYGCKVSAFPHPGFRDLSDPKVLDHFIERLGVAARLFAENGCTLAYHNHSVEFMRVGGKLILKRIYDEIPEMAAELDIYWIQVGGGNPVDWCNRLRGRMPIIHLKDYKITPEIKAIDTELGEGNLHIPAVVRAAENAGCEWFAVEQDNCGGDPFESMRKSWDYLQANVVSK